MTSCWKKNRFEIIAEGDRFTARLVTPDFEVLSVTSLAASITENANAYWTCSRLLSSRLSNNAHLTQAKSLVKVVTLVDRMTDYPYNGKNKSGIWTLNFPQVTATSLLNAFACHVTKKTKLQVLEKNVHLVSETAQCKKRSLPGQKWIAEKYSFHWCAKTSSQDDVQAINKRFQEIISTFLQPSSSLAAFCRRDSVDVVSVQSKTWEYHTGFRSSTCSRTALWKDWADEYRTKRKSKFESRSWSSARGWWKC